MFEDKTIFWVNHVSEDIIVKPTNQSKQMNLYDECAKSKTCFGLPNGCISSQDCVSFGAVIAKNGVYSFEMQSSSK